MPIQQNIQATCVPITTNAFLRSQSPTDIVIVLAYTLTRMPAKLLVGSIFGILVGLLIRSVPRPDSPSVHFVR
ncbi:hypothetical protein GPALN_011965 [Globodera pallida]|nr:hypothetical protein GPALN_011965 [Globodera pallida]